MSRGWTTESARRHTLREQDPNKAHTAAELKYTDAGRKVYSGGGVEPDRRFDGPVEGFSPTTFARTLNNRQLFDSFAQRFSRFGDARISARSTLPRELAPDFLVTDAMVAEFKEHVIKSRVKMDEAAWTKDLPFIRAMIRYEIDLDLFGVAAARKNLAKSDPQMQFALGLFPEAEQLLSLSKTAGARAAR